MDGKLKFCKNYNYMSLFLFIIGFLFLVWVTIYFSIILLRLNLYFLGFNIKKHPYLENLLKNILHNIAKKNDIGVFYFSCKELNEGIKDDDKLVSGRYVYCIPENDDDKRLLLKKNLLYNDILNMEKKYNQTYEEIFYEIKNKKPKTPKHKLCLPRIEIDKDSTFLYKTLAHELGHHFAIIQENNSSEERADEISADLIINNTPDYFRLLYGHLFKIEFQNNGTYFKKYSMPKGIKYWKLLWSYYWNYYRKRKKLNSYIEINI
jgi:hypothetical protein